MSDSMVHLVDDDAAIRESVGMLLETAGYPVRVYEDGERFLAAWSADWPPGCVVADVRMPGLSGIELVEELRRRRSALPVIVITGHADVAMAVRALKDGAADFIEKPFDEAVLLNSVRDALDLGRKAFREHRQDELIRQRHSELTAREQEVMALVVQGLPNKAVAARLDISVRTVEIHRARVMDKMEARSLSELVRMSLRLEG